MKRSTIHAWTLTALSTIFAVVGVNAQTAATQKQYDISNGDTSYTLYKKQTDQIIGKKMKQLESYLTILIEKKDGKAESTIQKAMALFNNDESRLVTVTNKNTGKVSVKPVRQYLNDVAALPYKSVKITYRNYMAVERIRKQPDGTFRGVAVFEQEFTGYGKEGQAMYSDVIRRNMEIVIKMTGTIQNDRPATHVDVFFGNLGVTQM